MNKYKSSTIFFALRRFLLFVFQNFPIAYLALIAIAVGILLEYLALSLMIPLGGGTQGVSLSIAQFWRQFAETIGLPDEPRVWLWLFLLTLGLRILIGLIQVALNTKVSKLIHSTLSSSSFSSVVSELPIRDIYKNSVGHYMALAGDDSIRVGQLFFSFLQILSASLSAAIGLFALFLFDLNAFMIILAFLFCSGAILSSLIRKVLSLSSRSRVLSKEVVSVFVDALNGLRSIRSIAAEKYVNLKYGATLNQYTKTLYSIDIFNHSSRTLPGLLLIVIGLIILFPGFQLAGDVPVIFFFTVIAIIIRILSFLGIVVFSAGRIVADIGAIYDLGHIMSLPRTQQIAKDKALIESVREIDIFNLSCGYIDGKDIIKKVSCELRAGKVYAVIGASGSGKSTLSDALLGHLRPTSGGIFIGKVSYDEISTMSLRQKIVLVEQQTRIFSGNIRENIQFGFNATTGQIKGAVKVAGLDEFAGELDDWLDTILEYQGANLSGGQRQRIGIARAVLREPDVLILDEATSALDFQTRDLVLTSLRERFVDKILIFITHDPMIANSADEVWTLKGGGLSIQNRGKKV